MQGLLRRSVRVQQQQVCRFKLLPAPSHHIYKGCRKRTSRLSKLRAASANDNAQQNPSDLSKQQESAEVQPALPPEQNVTDLPEQPSADDQLDSETSAAMSAAMALEDEQAAQEELLVQQPIWEVDQAAHRTAAYLYAAMALGLAASGLLVSVYAAPLASTCLNLGGMPAVQAAALVGCAGAGLIRAASLALFLADGAAACELDTWRYQRINLGLMACCAIAAAVQLFNFSAAQAPVLLALLAASAAGAVTCARVFLRFWRSEGIFFASAAGYTDWIGSIQAAFVYFMRDISSLAGTLLAVLGVLATLYGLQAVMSPAVPLGLPWLTGAAAAAQTAGLHYLRQLLGAGLLVTAVQCWALSEFASQARKVTPETAIKLLLVAEQEQREYESGMLPAPIHVPLTRFNLLHVGFVAAAVVQGLWLWTAGSAGGPAAAGVVNINSADTVWAALYWTLLCSAAYIATVVGRVDFTVVWGWIIGFASYLSGWVSFFTVILYSDWEWLKDVRRK